MGSGYVAAAMLDGKASATVDFLVNSSGLFICLFSLLKTMSMADGVKGTEVTDYCLLTVSAAFCLIV